MEFVESKFYTDLIQQQFQPSKRESEEATLFGDKNVAAIKEQYIESIFHHYLPAQKEQQTFRFEDGTEDNYVFYVAEKLLQLSEQKEDIEISQKPNYLSIDVEQLLE